MDMKGIWNDTYQTRLASYIRGDLGSGIGNERTECVSSEARAETSDRRDSGCAQH